MAGIGLIALLDDIASVLDDVAVLTKVAARKTAGVLGDDLALNAEQVSGLRAERELPVVWAVAKGSALNKAILVPAALAISALVPAAITPLLMLGGGYLCYEGFEKVAHRFLRSPAEREAEHAALAKAIVDPATDLVAFEKAKIKGAIRTDFVLSAEIIVIALGIVAGATFGTQVAALVGIAALMTIGVYGVVAGIVKLDDAGLYLSKRGGEGAFARFQRALGRGILRTAPWFMKGLSVAGTVAMFLVGGGILTHGVPVAHHVIAALVAKAAVIPGIGGVLHTLAPLVADAVVGVVAGAVILLVVTLVRKAWPARTTAP